MRFFFYGTLIAGSGNPMAAAIHAKLKPVGRASLAGRLYAIPDPYGWYPAMLPGAGRIFGIVYEATAEFGREDLARIDFFEGFDPRDPQSSSYLRKRMKWRSGRLSGCAADTYLFNRPLPPGSRRIAGGDFHAWLEKTGLMAYSGK